MAELAVASIATGLVIGWLYLFIKYGSRYEELIAGIDDEIYPAAELFFIGFSIMELVHFNMGAKWCRKRIHDIEEINGKKYAQYYFYVTIGAEITYAYVSLMMLCALSAVAVNPMLAALGVVLAVLAVLYFEQAVGNQLSERHDALLAEFPHALSKLALLVNSGMVMREAWEKTASTGEGVLYGEMQTAIQEFHNGVSEVTVYRNFAERCGIKEIRRFSSTMIQNLQKGSDEIAFFLRELSEEMWEEKKHLAKRKGEAANSKLMLPTGLIFIGILLMIMVPAFLGM